MSTDQALIARARSPSSAVPAVAPSTPCLVQTCAFTISQRDPAVQDPIAGQGDVFDSNRRAQPKLTGPPCVLLDGCPT